MEILIAVGTILASSLIIYFAEKKFDIGIRKHIFIIRKEMAQKV